MEMLRITEGRTAKEKLDKREEATGSRSYSNEIWMPNMVSH